MIDSEGFRSNIGIILANTEGNLLWAKRITGTNAWQFPQGGINKNESIKDALYRELFEEVGLKNKDVEVLGCTQNWLKYRLPNKLIRKGKTPVCIGQKQRWFLLKLKSPDDHVKLDNSETPEFITWKWVSYWYPLEQVVSFKKEVYRKALKELSWYMRKLYNKD